MEEQENFGWIEAASVRCLNLRMCAKKSKEKRYLYVASVDLENACDKVTEVCGGFASLWNRKICITSSYELLQRR